MVFHLAALGLKALAGHAAVGGKAAAATKAAAGGHSTSGKEGQRELGGHTAQERFGRATEKHDRSKRR